MSAITSGYRSITAVAQLIPVNIKDLFKAPAAQPLRSPIDVFIGNTNKLNKLYLPYMAQDASGWMPELGSLIFLGYMSAIESYVRALVTGLINLDVTARRHAGKKQISFAVATSHPNPLLLPEALMENISFSTAGNIEKALRELVGITPLSEDLKSTLSEFGRLCEVRHCCTHRFGKLGSQNAMELGFEQHKAAIEHPFEPSAADVERIADVLQVTVKTLNNFIYREVLDRTAKLGYANDPPWTWSWHFAKDRKRFTQYYDLFALTVTEPRSPSIKDVYQTFRTEHLPGLKRRREQRR